MDVKKMADALAAHERNENNRGKRVNQKGWKTKEQMQKEAAQNAIGLGIIVLVLTLLSNVFIKVFGKVMGVLVMVVLALGLPFCWFIEETEGCHVRYLPLWIVGVLLLARIVMKLVGRRWGKRILPLVVIVGIILYCNCSKKEAVASDETPAVDMSSQANEIYQAVVGGNTPTAVPNARR